MHRYVNASVHLRAHALEKSIGTFARTVPDLSQVPVSTRGTLPTPGTDAAVFERLHAITHELDRDAF